MKSFIKQEQNKKKIHNVSNGIFQGMTHIKLKTDCHNINHTRKVTELSTYISNPLTIFPSIKLRRTKIKQFYNPSIQRFESSCLLAVHYFMATIFHSIGPRKVVTRIYIVRTAGFLGRDFNEFQVEKFCDLVNRKRIVIIYDPPVTFHIFLLVERKVWWNICLGRTPYTVSLFFFLWIYFYRRSVKTGEKLRAFIILFIAM